jgi:Txe/YoeB family toxin of Txe-Axe toxin-antitoxin module
VRFRGAKEDTDWDLKGIWSKRIVHEKGVKIVIFVKEKKLTLYERWCFGFLGHVKGHLMMS